MEPISIVLGIIILIVAFIMLIIIFNYGFLWLKAKLCGVEVSIIDLFIMQWFRKIRIKYIVDALIMGAKAGITLTNKELQAHYLAGGDVYNVVKALIAADRADIPLDYEKATAIDLAGRDVLEAVRISVNPKVINCPDETKSHKKYIEAVAGDGIQIKARARVTVRANIEKLIGGASEETIIARVGEGIVTSIGSAASHKDVLENPDIISKKVLEKGLDSGTAYTILSIDIADVNVGRNIGAILQTDQAEADMRVAQAKAEKMRAMAVAEEQEMAAKVKENEAKVMLAKAEVPKSIAESLRNGKMSVMEYYKLLNIQADTTMRNSIGEPERRN